jgi:hypothetical protein
MTKAVVELARIDHVVPDTLGTLLRTRDIHVIDQSAAVGSDWYVVGVEVFGQAAWEMTLAMPEATARRLTSEMLWNDVVDVSSDDVVDAAGEVLSIVATRCRAVSDLDTWMGTPSVRQSSNPASPTAAVQRWFAWGHDLLCFSTQSLVPC